MASPLTFYFDPTCPWTWRTAQWVREARLIRPLDITWKVFSLQAQHHEGGPDPKPSALSLRTLILARRVDGNEGIERLYQALGEAHHERGQDVDTLQTVEEALITAALPSSLAREAVEDSTTDQDVKAEHREALNSFGAYGVPWLVLNDQQFGFNGPIIISVPQGAEAGMLWDHVSWLLGQEYFYELKRERS